MRVICLAMLPLFESYRPSLPIRSNADTKDVPKGAQYIHDRTEELRSKVRQGP